MRKIFVLILIMALASACLANPKVWFDKHADKMGHLFAGGFVAGLSYKLGAEPTSIALNVTALGGLKEWFDYTFAKKWDNGDWVATMLGGIIFILF